jgi:hypothetical protein
MATNPGDKKEKIAQATYKFNQSFSSVQGTPPPHLSPLFIECFVQIFVFSFGESQDFGVFCYQLTTSTEPFLSNACDCLHTLLIYN